MTHILASAAVGSLREKIAPRDLVLPDQAIDKTYCRPSSFFDGLAVHVEMANPFCPSLRSLLASVATGLPVNLHSTGTYVCMEGPQFSTRAESEMHRAWGADLIGMTLLPEAKLAREAEICYAAVALVTDYDCWRKRILSEDKVELLQEILANVKAATQNALQLIGQSLPYVAAQADQPCDCQSALRLAIWSDRSMIPDDVSLRLSPLLGKYLG